MLYDNDSPTRSMETITTLTHQQQEEKQQRKQTTNTKKVNIRNFAIILFYDFFYI
jgi:hypothetical protein